ncbi:hypothetical protein AN958_11512, partial [Leucoagaricus sp. SymC.cos]
ADATFPSSHGVGLPPSPTVENPGQVYPKSDPTPAQRTPRSGDDSRAQTAVGNPFLLQSALEKVDRGLVSVLVILKEEERAQGVSQKDEALIKKFQGWRDELGEIMTTGSSGPPHAVSASGEYAGGMFTD